MEGPNSQLDFDSETGKPQELAGILPRVACFIWKEIERYKTTFNQEMFIEVSALEIYCENIRDLLWQPESSQDLLQPRYVEMKTIGSKVHCIGQTWVRVDSPKLFMQQIIASRDKRVFKANGVHPHSSRSHHIFQIRINSLNRLGKPHKSLLNIVDLAGSERRNNFYQDCSTNSVKIHKQSLKVVTSPKLSPEQPQQEVTQSKVSMDHPIPLLTD